MVRLSGFLQGIDEANQLLSRVRDCHVVVLALGSLLGEVSMESWVSMANVLGGVVESKTQVSGAPLLHMGVAVVELARLVCRG